MPVPPGVHRPVVDQSGLQETDGSGGVKVGRRDLQDRDPRPQTKTVPFTSHSNLGGDSGGPVYCFDDDMNIHVLSLVSGENGKGQMYGPFFNDGLYSQVWTELVNDNLKTTRKTM